MADNYRQITDFLSTNNVSAEEAAEGFKIMALIKNDPWRRVKPCSLGSMILTFMREIVSQMIFERNMSKAIWMKRRQPIFNQKPKGCGVSARSTGSYARANDTTGSTGSAR